MNTFDVSGWPRHELRLVYFDFMVRGEGDSTVVRAVLREWHRLGAISDAVFELWNDAVRWREYGNRLPGWTIPPDSPSARLSPPTDADFERFLRWRRTLGEPAASAAQSRRSA